MGFLRTVDEVSNFTNQAISTNTETIILTSPKITTPAANGFVVLLAIISVTLGGAVTSNILRIRKGTSLSGTVVGNPLADSGVSAALQYKSSSFVIDTYSSTDSVQYVVTMQQGGANSNATVQEATLMILTF